MLILCVLLVKSLLKVFLDSVISILLCVLLANTVTHMIIICGIRHTLVYWSGEVFISVVCSLYVLFSQPPPRPPPTHRFILSEVISKQCRLHARKYRTDGYFLDIPSPCPFSCGVYCRNAMGDVVFKIRFQRSSWIDSQFAFDACLYQMVVWCGTPRY